MKSRAAAWRSRLWPRIPAAIADEFALIRVERLEAVVPLLYAMLIAVVLTTTLSSTSDTPLLLVHGEMLWIIRFAVPLTIAAVAALRLVHWVRRRGAPTSAETAHRLIGRLVLLAIPLAGVCGLWAAASWQMSVPGQRSYYPMFAVMGMLTAAFCLVSLRGLTLAVLASGLAPVIVALLIGGNGMDHVAVAIILFTTACLIRLVLDQHNQQIEMLLLRRRLHRQAMTDPLTGLANRRALHVAAEKMINNGCSGARLIVIDLDRFKPVNDHHGHAAGDLLLIAIGGRLRAQAGEGATVARLGGDEFAILMPGSDPLPIDARASAMLGALAAPFPINGQRINIGATSGFAQTPHDGETLLDLLRVADAALYAAKPVRDEPTRTVSALPAPKAHDRPTRRARNMRRLTADSRTS